MVELPLDHLDGPMRGGRRLELVGPAERREKHRVARREVAAAVCEDLGGARFELCQLFVGQQRAPLERLRTLERRCCVTQPDALQVGMAVRRTRRLPGRGIRLCRRGGSGWLRVRRDGGRRASQGANHCPPSTRHHASCCRSARIHARMVAYSALILPRVRWRKPAARPPLRESGLTKAT